MNIKITDNVYGLDVNDWFITAKRVNKKRSFLFVSKRLGKHLEAESHKALYAGMMLARRLNELFVRAGDEFDWDLTERDFVDRYLMDSYKNEKKIVFIGFAETATGLGQSVFDRFENSYYFHTTREIVESRKSVLDFEEEHSHDSSHRSYVEDYMIDNELPVVLVDDEMTTGNTCLNIIKEIHRKYPRKEYTVVSILNWMSEEEINRYKNVEVELGITINIVYLFKGEVDRNLIYRLDDNELIVETNNEFGNVEIKKLDFEKVYGDYIKGTGRFGITYDEHKNLKERILRNSRVEEDDVLVIGNGELMYIPIIIAYSIGDKKVKSTTRSPIFVENKDGYEIKTGILFKSVDGKGIDNYLYNINSNDYEKGIFLVEGHINEESMKDFVDKLTSFGNFTNVEIHSI